MVDWEEHWKQRDLENKERAEIDERVVKGLQRYDDAYNPKTEPTTGGGGASVDWGLPGEKTGFARFVLKVGWTGVVVGILLWALHKEMPDMMGELVPSVVIGIGVFCLVLIYLFQVVILLLLIPAIVIPWYMGTTADGFEFSAVPFWAYLTGVGLVAFAYFLKKILLKD
jgi:hypothetical protein